MVCGLRGENGPHVQSRAAVVNDCVLGFVQTLPQLTEESNVLEIYYKKEHAANPVSVKTSLFLLQIGITVGVGGVVGGGVRISLSGA